MLRLKRRSRNSLSIVFHQKARAPKRFLFRGVVFALLFHLCALFLFQIRVQYGETTSSEEVPMVLLDSEESLISILTEETQPDEDYSEKLNRALHLKKNVFTGYLKAFSNNFQFSELPQPSSENRPFFIPLLPWSFSDHLSPSRYSVRAYPLKIDLQAELRRLYFIDDGAELFRKASYDTLFTSPFFAESQPKVSFHIDVSLKTGKITRIVCLRELVDKRLHEVALKLLHTFRFASTREETSETISGEIFLQFSGTFDAIEPLLSYPSQGGI